MTLLKRIAASLAAITVAAGGLVLATAGAATAAPICVTDGISREVRDDGVPVFRNNPDCGELYQYDRPPVVHPKPHTPVLHGDGCMTGIIGDIACQRPQHRWTVPHPIWAPHPGHLPGITGYEYPDGTVTVGEPEPVPEDEGSTGGGGGGGWSGGGGGIFLGGGWGGGGSGTVTVGEPEPVGDQQAQ